MTRAPTASALVVALVIALVVAHVVAGRAQAVGHRRHHLDGDHRRLPLPEILHRSLLLHHRFALLHVPQPVGERRRRELALTGLEELRAICDGVICLPNQKILKLIDDKTSGGFIRVRGAPQGTA